MHTGIPDYEGIVAGVLEYLRDGISRLVALPVQTLEFSGEGENSGSHTVSVWILSEKLDLEWGEMFGVVFHFSSVLESCQADTIIHDLQAFFKWLSTFWDQGYLLLSTRQGRRLILLSTMWGIVELRWDSSVHFLGRGSEEMPTVHKEINKYNKNKSMTFEINKNSFLPEVSENLEVCVPVEKPDCRPVGRKEISDTSRAREEIKRQIEYDVMVQRCQPSQLDELVEIMLEVRMNLSPTTRFSRDEVYPTVYVQDRYSRLNAEHIEQVLDGIRENTSKVMHTKAYLMKCLFNAPETLESKVMMDVNHDLYGERRRE